MWTKVLYTNLYHSIIYNTKKKKKKGMEEAAREQHK